MENTTKITKFNDLIAWKKGHELLLLIYKNTNNFPPDERFGITSQLRRAGVSITSNIAEGFSRHSKKEKIQFYFTSMGSISEVQNQLIIAKDLDYIELREFEQMIRMSIATHKLINGLVRSIRRTL